MRRFHWGVVCFALCLACVAGRPVILEKLAQVYLPFQFGPDGEPIFCLGEAAAEQVVYDRETFFLYVTGNKQLRVLDLTDPQVPAVVFTRSVPGELTDVALCGDWVAASVLADPEALPGKVFLYSKYTEDDGLQFQHEVEVGAAPDSLVFTPDCSKLIVANEGEAGLTKKGKFINPEGSISIIDMEGLMDDEPDAVQTVDFTSFNEDPENATDAGVRWVWRGQTLRNRRRRADQTFSKDMEPEQVVVSEDGKLVYVNLQENNALAILDLETMRFTSIVGYGEKDLSLRKNALDTSKTDGPGVLRTWKGLFSVYQPDVIAVFNHEGEDFIITANEGDQKEYGPEEQGIPEWIEFVDGAVLVNRTEGIPEKTAAALADPDQLGQLPISTVDGVVGENENGEELYGRLVTYGGRSWSIYRASDMEQVYDSGNDFERLIATFIPWAFNNDEVDAVCLTPPPGMESSENEEEDIDTLVNNDLLQALIEDANDELTQAEATLIAPGPETDELIELPSNALTTTPNDTVDARSTSRGPEPEALIVGYLRERRLVFVSVEKGGAIFVYDASDPLSPSWQSTLYPGAHGKTWAELYNNQEIADIDPEGMEFVSADDSPTGEPLLIVSGAISGTVSIHAVRTADVNPSCEKEAEVVDDGETTLVISTQTEGC